MFGFPSREVTPSAPPRAPEGPAPDAEVSATPTVPPAAVAPAAVAPSAIVDGLVNFGGNLIVRSTDTGQFLLVNRAFEHFIGKPAAEIIGRTVRDVYHPDDAATILARDQAVFSGIVRPAVIELRDGTGAIRQLIAHKFPLFDPDGRRFAVASLSMDITPIEAEMERQRDAKNESDARFQAVFDHAPIGQIFSSIDGVITSVNEPMAAMLGLRPDEMMGRAVRDYASDTEYARIRTATEQLLRREILSVSEVRHFRHNDGHDVPVRVNSALLRNRRDEPRWWVSMAVDITAEEQARADLERAHAAALVSAARLRLLHSIATAANEAHTLDALAPRALSEICAHFEWDGGALVRWADAVPRPDAEHGARTELEGLLVPSGDHVVLLDGHRVCVPLPSGGHEPAALVFTVPAGSGLDDDQREVLSLVAIETARVIEREAAEQRLRTSEERFRSTFDSSPLPMGLTLGHTGTYHAVNNALCELLGRPAADLVGHSAAEFCHPDDIALADPAGAAALAAADRRHRVEMRLVRSSGAVLTTVVTLAWIDGPDGGLQLLAQMEDITARRTVEDVLRRQAEQDGLTGLANRTLLGRMLCELGETAQPCAILFIDLDGFKLINDTRGHDVGDEVLLEVASRLRVAIRPSDVVARFGGDEFVVVCHGGLPGDELPIARRVADRIEDSLRRPITTQDGPAMVTASIGIAGGTVDPHAPQDLLQRADAAMYQAKRLGKDRREIYDDHLHERALDHQRTEAALRNALDDNRFVVYYQPIVDLADSSVAGFEALLRLEDEQGRLVPPSKFIAVAEQSGLIVPMGTWVLAESCETIAWLRERTGRPFTVSVNIAARQAARADFADTVTCALKASGLPERALMLELTESALLEADDTTLDQLNTLRSLGVRIGLDDFGTGYSSLAYLRRLPVSHLKVDRSFVSGMQEDPTDLAIVRAVTGLASELGMRWIAEGVETVEQRDLLAGLGPGLAQGFLFSRPVPRQELRHLVEPLSRTA